MITTSFSLCVPRFPMFQFWPNLWVNFLSFCLGIVFYLSSTPPQVRGSYPRGSCYLPGLRRDYSRDLSATQAAGHSVALGLFLKLVRLKAEQVILEFYLSSRLFQINECD